MRGDNSFRTIFPQKATMTACRFSQAVLILTAMAVPGHCDVDSVAAPQACALGDAGCSDKSLLQRRRSEVNGGRIAEPILALMQQVSEPAESGSSSRQAKLHSIMMQLVASKNELSVTPGLKDSLDKITEFVGVIKGKVTEEHTNSVTYMETTFGSFADCSGKLTTTIEGDVNDAKEEYDKARAPHQECRADEAQEKDEHDACEATESDKLGTKTTNCELFDEAERRAIDVAAHKAFVDFLEDEGSYAYITRLHEHFKDLWEKFVAAKELCDTATDDHDKEQTACDTAEQEHTTKKDECDDAQETLDDAACLFAVKKKQSCDTYDECYTTSKTSYDAAVSLEQMQVADRKAEWESAHRIECITGTFGNAEEEGSSHDVSGMQDCLSKAIPTDFLNIAFKDAPAADECTPEATADPCSDEYKTKEFANLPANAPAEECRVCPGL